MFVATIDYAMVDNYYYVGPKEVEAYGTVVNRNEGNFIKNVTITLGNYLAVDEIEGNSTGIYN